MSRPSPQPVYSVTAARAGTSDDLSQRTRRYLISMSIRTAAFVAAVLTHGPTRWVLVAAALILPYIAVVMANAAASTSGPAPTAFVPQQATIETAQRVVLDPPAAPTPPSPTPTAAQS